LRQGLVIKILNSMIRRMILITTDGKTPLLKTRSCI
jgi:hypothetical protein